jgi:hypothetical protein
MTRAHCSRRSAALAANRTDRKGYHHSLQTSNRCGCGMRSMCLTPFTMSQPLSDSDLHGAAASSHTAKSEILTVPCRYVQDTMNALAIPLHDAPSQVDVKISHLHSVKLHQCGFARRSLTERAVIIIQRPNLDGMDRNLATSNILSCFRVSISLRRSCAVDTRNAYG